MVCTDDAELLRSVLRMLRSHGMVREAGSAAERRRWTDAHPDLNPDFIFACPAYNVRSTEINAVIGRSQLRRLDDNNDARRRNLRALPGPPRSRALPDRLRDRGQLQLRLHAGAAPAGRAPARPRDGGAARARRRVPARHLRRRQPAAPALPARDRRCRPSIARFPRVDHVHFFGFYIGNYPDLEPDRIAVALRYPERACSHETQR